MSLGLPYSTTLLIAVGSDSTWTGRSVLSTLVREESLKLYIKRGITYGHIKSQPVLSDKCHRASQDEEHS